MSTDTTMTEIGIGSAMAGRVIDRKIFEAPVTILASLTRFEQMIFTRLQADEGKIVSKDELVKVLYPDGTAPNSNGIEVFVGRLRRKIGEHRVTTIRGKGYKLNPDEPITIAVSGQ